MRNIREAVKRLSDKGAYNQGQDPGKQAVGAYLAWSTAAKLKILPPKVKAQEENDLVYQNENELAYGSLKNAGMNNNVEEVNKILTDKNANMYSIPKDLMAYLWGTNEHTCLHAYMFQNNVIKNTIHMTSLNDQDVSDGDDHPGEKDGLRGGFNDKGQAPQHGIWDDAPKFLAELGLN